MQALFSSPFLNFSYGWRMEVSHFQRHLIAEVKSIGKESKYCLIGVGWGVMVLHPDGEIDQQSDVDVGIWSLTSRLWLVGVLSRMQPTV